MADVSELGLDLFSVLFGHLLLPLGALGLLLDRRDDAPGRPEIKSGLGSRSGRERESELVQDFLG